MAFRLTRHLTIAAPDALARIAALTGEWREPEPDLLTALEMVTSSRVHLRGERFRITLHGIRSNATVYPEVEGKVVSTGPTSSTLTARVGAARFGEWEVYALVAVVILVGYLGGWIWGAVLLTSFAIRALVVSGADRGMSYTDNPLARALADRLDRTFADALLVEQSESQVPVA